MKKYLILVAVWTVLHPLCAQMNIDKHIDFAGKKSLKLDIQFADTIRIHTWNKNEVYAKASVNINNNMDNEKYHVTIDDVADLVRIKTTMEEKYFHDRKHDCIEMEIYWDVYFPENTPLSVETINGNIIIEGMTSEIIAKSISGFIDWSVLPDRKADLKLKTVTGTFYSDIDPVTGKSNASFPPELTALLNQGGNKVNLETISGDIFCRKAK